jgi:hypothetical protein
MPATDAGRTAPASSPAAPSPPSRPSRASSFQPGQFTWLSLWNGPFGMREPSCSFLSSAERQGQVAITLRELGDFTSSWPRRCAPHAGPGTARDAGSLADDHGMLEQDAPHLLDGYRVTLHRVFRERDHER